MIEYFVQGRKMDQKHNLSACKKIGIMGGTFNPIHIGHILMAQWAMEFAGLDGVIFMPTGNPYMKAGTEILEGRERLYMVKLGIAGEPHFFASDMEIRREGNTYTCETLEALKMEYPESELYFIAGADCLYSFERWYHPEKILENSTLIAAARNGSALDALESKREELMTRFGGRILLMEFPAMDISSTMLRTRIREGKSIRYLTPDRVCGYIQEKHFYLEKEALSGVSTEETSDQGI